MNVSVFVDVTDPWSYIGATRFERAAALFSILTGHAVTTSFRAAPPAGSGTVEDAVAAARITGIELNIDERVDADPADAWRLVTWAGESGPGTQRDLLHQLWRAHLLEGADIGDHFTLATRAALVGLDLETAEALLASDEYAAEVAVQREAAVAVGVARLPFVVVENRWTLEGLLSQDDYLQALRRIYGEWSPSS